MATIIDSLLITMGMDTTAYRKGQREVEDGARKVNEAERLRGKESAAASKAMAEGFRGARNELMSLVGIALGATGIKNFFAGMVKDQASLGRFAKDLNMSARELDAWGAAAEQVGGTADGMRSSMQSILGGFEAYSLGENSPVVQAFRALQVNIADSSGKIRPMKDLLLDVAAALQKMPAQDQIRIGGMLGLDRGTLDLLRQGSAQVGDIVAQMEKASGVTEESTRAAAKSQAQWASFNRELKGVGQTIFSALIPSMDGANGQLRQFSGWINDHKDEIGQFVGMLASGFTAVGRAIGEAFGWFYKLGEKLSGTSIGNKLGETIAKVLAYGGNKEAQAALVANGAAPASSTAAPKVTGAKPGNDFDAFVKATAAELNVPPALMWGKIRNEVGWKNSTVGDFNFGNVKAGSSWKGATKEKEVWENIGGKDVMRKEVFRSYASIQEAAADYVKMMRHAFPRVEGAASGAEFTDALKNGRYGSYATDPGYASKIMSMARRAPAEFGGGSTTTTTIQNMTINTKATDAPGIARSLSDELSKSQKISFGAVGMR